MKIIPSITSNSIFDWGCFFLKGSLDFYLKTPAEMSQPSFRICCTSRFLPSSASLEAQPSNRIYKRTPNGGGVQPAVWGWARCRYYPDSPRTTSAVPSSASLSWRRWSRCSRHASWRAVAACWRLSTPTCPTLPWWPRSAASRDTRGQPWRVATFYSEILFV